MQEVDQRGSRVQWEFWPVSKVARLTERGCAGM